MSTRNDGAVSLAYSEYNYSGDRANGIPPVIIMHCLFGNRLTWERVASNLARQTGQIVYSLDLRNHGTSPRHANGDLNDYVADLEKFLNSREISEGHFIGHSLGGKIQLQLAFKKPEMVKSLILVDFLPITTPKYLHTHAKKCIPILRGILEDLNESGISKMEQAKNYCLQEMKENKLVRHPVVKLLPISDLYVKEEPETFRRALNFSMNLNESGFDWAFNLNYLDKHIDNFLESQVEGKCYAGPTLILSPRKSIFVTPEAIEKISEALPNRKHRVISNVTHNMHMDNPEEFVRECAQFWFRLETVD